MSEDAPVQLCCPGCNRTMLATSLLLVPDAEMLGPFGRIVERLARFHPWELLRGAVTGESALFVADTNEELLRWPASRPAVRCGGCRITAIA